MIILVRRDKYNIMYISEISDEKAIRRISHSSIKRLISPKLKWLIQAIENYQFHVRIVGGAVRDLLIGHPPRDIDLLTDALPDQIIFIAEELGLHPYTKGIPHGTIKIKFSETEEYEITSTAFEIDAECCPPHLNIHSSGSWKEDAQRRDFTIDTLSVTLDGLLYDYLDGFNDLRQQVVRFIGDPEERIKKDPVMILRFFKLLSMFSNPKFDKSILPMIKERMKSIRKLKPERIQLELSNIAKGPNAEKARRMLTALGFDDVMNQIKIAESLLEYVTAHDLVPALKVKMPDGRMKILRGQKGETHADIYVNHAPRPARDGAVQEKTQWWDTMPFESGFFNLRTRQFLTRAEATQLVGVGQSHELKQIQRSDDHFIPAQ